MFPLREENEEAQHQCSHQKEAENHQLYEENNQPNEMKRNHRQKNREMKS